MAAIKPSNYPNGVKAKVVADVSVQTGTTYTFTPADDYVRFTNGGAITATILKAAVMPVPWRKGETINVEQGGAGKVTMTAGSGVTFHSAGGLLGTSAQYAVISAINVDGADTWTIFGSLA